MIRVHHLNDSRSQRVLWLLEEMAVPYELVTYTRDRKTMLAPPDLKRIHPLGKSPVIEDGTRILPETGAIIDYLVTTYGPRLAPPPDSDLQWRYAYWLHYAEGSAMMPLILKLLTDKMGPLGWPVRPFVRSQLTLHLDYLEHELTRSPWFVRGGFSAADIIMSFPLELAVSRRALNASRPSLWTFLERIHARPAYRRAVARGGQYTYAS